MSSTTSPDIEEVFSCERVGEKENDEHSAAASLTSRPKSLRAEVFIVLLLCPELLLA